MANQTVVFSTAERDHQATIKVPSGTLLSEASHRAGLEISQPCGGQGRCGRCLVQITKGNVRKRSTLRLTEDDISHGYTLACQSVVEEDLSVLIPVQEKITRRLNTDRIAVEVRIPTDYDFYWSQSMRRVPLRLNPPNIDDQTDDWSRLQICLRTQANLQVVNGSISFLRNLSSILRESAWEVTAIVDTVPGETGAPARLIDVRPNLESDDEPLWAVAIDIGTTTVTVWLVELVTGQVRAQCAEYNNQIACGEDVISRIIYANKEDGAQELHERVTSTINGLVKLACKQVKAKPTEIVKATIVGNSTMMHLLLRLPPDNIRLSPFITVVNQSPMVTAREIGLAINPEATVDCLPGVASYVGADITAGVLSSGVAESETITLFLDVGTNGEMVLGNRDWLITCACSAGPAFEGAGVMNGMRATEGAIEEVWINSETYEPTYRVIGNGKPRGICGSGLIALIAEMFLNEILDKGGNINLTLPTKRIREGKHGGEYVIAWAKETEQNKDIVITHVDVDNLLRAKAAIYAGYTVLAEQVGVTLGDVSKMLIGGSFGQHINVEKAIQIGLLPDMPWERFEFLGNTAVRGAYYALLDWQSRRRVSEIAQRLTYIELSADNTFYDAFMSAMFLPHTDLARFPSVKKAYNNNANIMKQVESVKNNGKSKKTSQTYLNGK